MIKINDTYAITADANGYSIVKRCIAGPDAKEPGKEYTIPVNSYHTTVNGAIKALIKRMQRESIAEHDVDLKGALEIFKAIEDNAAKWMEV